MTSSMQRTIAACDGELTLACLTILSNMMALMSFDKDDVGAGGLRSSQVETVYNRVIIADTSRESEAIPA
jgi:hypothetical protein